MPPSSNQLVSPTYSGGHCAAARRASSAAFGMAILRHVISCSSLMRRALSYHLLSAMSLLITHYCKTLFAHRSKCMAAAYAPTSVGDSSRNIVRGMSPEFARAGPSFETVAVLRPTACYLFAAMICDETVTNGARRCPVMPCNLRHAPSISPIALAGPGIDQHK